MKWVAIVGATIVVALTIACGGSGNNGIGTVGDTCNTPNAVRTNSDHTQWTCEYPDNDTSHLHWVRTS